MAWQIRLKASVEKELRSIPATKAECILSELEQLADRDPLEQGKRLEGSDFYSRRAASYRIIYRVAEDENTVVILRIGHRGSVYRNIERLN